MSKFAILLGGPITPTPRLKRQLDGTRVIAADSGMSHAAALKLVPEIWVGDFDSSPKQLVDHWHNVPRQHYPAEKDASDGELAISEALRRGATSLILVGGMGGQLDHILAHAGFLLALAKRDIDVFMTSGSEEAWGLAHTVEISDANIGQRISVLPFTDLMGFSISGVKWPLAGRNVKLGTAHTLANVATGPVKISLSAGSAVVVSYPGVTRG